jgi:hypothetical protein
MEIHMQELEFEVPVSLGEVFDKITILRIKKKNIADAGKLANVEKELRILELKISQRLGDSINGIRDIVDNLQEVNQKLWVIEDEIRNCERVSNFGPDFVEYARAVYFTNDERARLKKEINIALGSSLVEEKSYSDYSSGKPL